MSPSVSVEIWPFIGDIGGFSHPFVEPEFILKERAISNSCYNITPPLSKLPKKVRHCFFVYSLITVTSYCITNFTLLLKMTQFAQKTFLRLLYCSECISVHLGPMFTRCGFPVATTELGCHIACTLQKKLKPLGLTNQ